MPQIRDINIRSLDIPEIPDWATSQPQSIPPVVPVTHRVGVPIIDIPGCVEAHPQDRGKNKELKGDDERGSRVFCDGNMPSYNPIDYNADELEFSGEAEVPKVKPPETPKVTAPEIPKDVTSAKIDCPSEAQALKEPIGFVKGDERVIEYRLVGKECIQITDKLDIPTQIIENIPSAGAVTTTASIAVVATTSALLAKPLADLLLKVIKPTVKKVIKKIAAIRGKAVKVESLKERRGQQRQRNKAIRILKGRE
tara:strand:- start:1236 stop:1994 length:759 start_codon:yes stop_codon:yes gene_type:complete